MKISKELYERAVKVIPAGVTRPFRFFNPYPFYVKKALGSRLISFEDISYLDFWVGHAALVLGHMHPAVVKATKEQLELGFNLGVCNEWEVELAEQVVKSVPSVDMIAFSNSGTEANMHALKLARAYTKRNKIGKFRGHFHGVLDPLFIAVSDPWDESMSAGNDLGASKNTILLPFNDLEKCSSIIKSEQLACVMIEPVKGSDAIPANKEFLKGLREMCDETGTLLIFDEVITGFRLALGGAQEAFGTIPDLTTFGKAIGGGEFPVGALGGSREILEYMNHLKYPSKSEYVARGGTYSGNPLVMRAGCEAIKEYKKGEVYQHINELGGRLKKGLEKIIEDARANTYVTGFGSMIKIHFIDKNQRNRVKNLKIISDNKVEKKYFHHLLANKIFAMNSEKVHFFVSLPHTKEEIDSLVLVTEDFLRSKANVNN